MGWGQHLDVDRETEPSLPQVKQGSPVVCAFCSHANPQGSAFCNECGSALKLVLCDACAAINDRTAETCHKCGAALLSFAHAAGAAPTHASPVEAREPHAPTLATVPANSDAVPITPSPRPTWNDRRLSPVLAVVAMCALGALAYLAYQRSGTPREGTLVVSQPPAESAIRSEDTAAPSSATPGDSPTRSGTTLPAPATPFDPAMRPESSVQAGVSEGPRDEPEQRPPVTSSPNVERTPTATTDPPLAAQNEPALAATPAESSQVTQNSAAQPTQNDTSTPQAVSSAAQSQRTERQQRQQDRSAKRGNSSSASSKPSPPPLSPAPLIAQRAAGLQGSEANSRVPAACTVGVAALGLCNRTNPDQGK